MLGLGLGRAFYPSRALGSARPSRVFGSVQSAMLGLGFGSAEQAKLPARLIPSSDAVSKLANGTRKNIIRNVFIIDWDRIGLFSIQRVIV